MKTVLIDGSKIKDETTFHRLFAKTFGFPAFYGNNFDAWIDCMDSLDAPAESAMCSFHIAPHQQVIIHIKHAEQFKTNCPQVWLTFLECTAFINGRRLENKQAPVLMIATS